MSRKSTLSVARKGMLQTRPRLFGQSHNRCFSETRRYDCGERPDNYSTSCINTAESVSLLGRFRSLFEVIHKLHLYSLRCIYEGRAQKEGQGS